MDKFSSSELIYFVDLAGTFVFAVSGWLLASKKELDFFGAAVISFITAVGGGTLRDVLIGSTPVGWMQDINYLLIIASAMLATVFFKRIFEKLRRTMFLFDSIGIGLFTILGVQKTLGLGLSPVVAIMMGTISAVFGGVLRDTLVNEIPLIFRREVYATVCVAGGTTYWLLGDRIIGSPMFLIFDVENSARNIVQNKINAFNIGIGGSFNALTYTLKYTDFKNNGTVFKPLETSLYVKVVDLNLQYSINKHSNLGLRANYQQSNFESGSNFGLHLSYSHTFGF
jgi:uncharacterized membrane protein YeiH